MKSYLFYVLPVTVRMKSVFEKQFIWSNTKGISWFEIDFHIHISFLFRIPANSLSGCCLFLFLFYLFVLFVSCWFAYLQGCCFGGLVLFVLFLCFI